MSYFGFEKDICGGKCTASITRADQLGNIRPDHPSFPDRIKFLRTQLGIKGDIIAQRLGMNQQITDLLQSPEAIKRWPNPNNDSKQIQYFWRTEEQTDGLILPGSNWQQLESIDHNLIDEIKAIRSQIQAVQIYNADCPVLTITDTRNRINAVLHSGLDCLFSKPSKQGEGGGESLLVNLIKHLQETHDIAPEELELHFDGGACPCCFGYKIDPELSDDKVGHLRHQLNKLEQYQQQTTGSIPIVERGDQQPTNLWQRFKHLFTKSGIKRGPRQGGDSINIGELARRQAVEHGVKASNITINQRATCCRGRRYSDAAKTKSHNSAGNHFSNIYRDPVTDGIDNRRQAYTVVQKRS